MRVRFGLHGDGLDLGVAGAVVGEANVGPRGLLGFLESDLGIAPVVAHPAEEAKQYRDCLTECDDSNRFYHRSFEADPVGTARTLLDWRRQWYLHGWDGAFPPQASKRLADMGAVESIATHRVAPCAGQRLRRILQLLNEQRTQISDMQLLDPPCVLPLLWRRLADRLGGRPLPDPTPAAPPDSDLGKLQALLARETPQPLRRDGSLVVVRAQSRDVTAQAVAEIVRQQRTGSTTVIASRDGIVLDNAFERVGVPRAGFQHYSPFRAASQVLKLALALLWEPLDPHRLLQFLIHPVGPLKWKVRTQLAEAVAAEPGIGGPAWQDALQAIDEGQDDVAFWTMPTRYPVREGAPVTVLRERAMRCAAWLQRRLNAPGTEQPAAAVYRAALAQAQAFASVVGHRDDERIARIEVDRLVDEVTRSLPDDSTFAEAGHVAAVAHPANVVAPVDDVLWWDIAPLRLNLQPTFSPAEQCELAAAGVRLPTPKQIIAAATRVWQRPVLNCRRRLVLVVHDEDEGRHPLWARVDRKFKRGWQDVCLDDALLHGQANAAQALRLALAPLPLQELPSKQRWWNLRRSIPARDVESFSSLAKAYYHPHQWVLNYHAKLRGSRISGVSDGPLLYGGLAHRLFERFFNENENWQALGKAEVDRWLRRVINDLIEKEGAVLLEYGRGVDRQRVETTLEDTLHRLLAHLRDANVREVSSEHAIERAFPDGQGQLRGSVDLLLLAENGARAVLDAKWGSEKFREAEIKEGRHLQLAIYGFGLSANDWPSSGYYIVTTGNVLAPSADFFPHARSAGDGDAASAETVWNKSLVTRAWRQEQLARGLIEVNAGADPDADSEPPADGLETRVEPDRFDDFAWLTGVDRSQ